MTHSIYNHGSWRYYSIEGKEIVSVAFFNQDGIVVQTRSGWLEKGDPATTYRKDVNPLVLERTPMRKIKPNFASLYRERQPFYIHDLQRYSIPSGYVLYLPFIPEDWTVKTECINQGTVRSKYLVYSHNKEQYYISHFVSSEPIPENVDFVKRVRELFKLAVYQDNAISDLSIIENRAKINELIKNFQSDGYRRPG